MNLSVDLERTKCPLGTKVEIEGLGQHEVNISHINLLLGIAHAHNILTGKMMTTEISNGSFLRRITSARFDEKAKKLSVTLSFTSAKN